MRIGCHAFPCWVCHAFGQGHASDGCDMRFSIIWGLNFDFWPDRRLSGLPARPPNRKFMCRVACHVGISRFSKPELPPKKAFRSALAQTHLVMCRTRYVRCSCKSANLAGRKISWQMRKVAIQPKFNLGAHRLRSDQKKTPERVMIKLSPRDCITR